jgi:hypothetical protein
MNRYVLIIMVFAFILSFGPVHTTSANDVSMQWDCSSEFGCSAHGDGCGDYNDIGNGNFDFVFDADPSLGIRHRLMNTVMFTSMVSI